MRSAEEFNAAKRLIAAGVNDCAIARQLGIPRPTVRDWRCRPRRPTEASTAARPAALTTTSPRSRQTPYCYLLGLYLGDGCISRDRRVWRLRIVLDKKYPGDHRSLPRGNRHADAQVSARGSVQPKGCVEVSLYSKHWPCLFPQHGPGKKHSRPIRLEPWQQALVDQATEEFILGLIHSDGCRVVANDRGVMQHPLPLLEHVRGHPRAVHRRT